MTSLFRLLPLSFALIGFVALVSAPSFSQSPNPKTLPIETVPSSGDRGEVTSVAFSPDGARVLSGEGNKVKLWDAATGQLLRTFEGHSMSVRSVAFSPDGTRVLSGSDDKTITLLDAATGQLLRTFEGHSMSVRSVAFSPDGTRVLSGSETIKLWDAATGQLLRTIVDFGLYSVGRVLSGRNARSFGER